MYTALPRAIAFWLTFYGAYNYASRDELTGHHVYPSYAILKQKLISETWEKGFEGDRFSDDFDLYRNQLWLEIKSLSQ